MACLVGLLLLRRGERRREEGIQAAKKDALGGGTGGPPVVSSITGISKRRGTSTAPACDQLFVSFQVVSSPSDPRAPGRSDGWLQAKQGLQFGA